MQSNNCKKNVDDFCVELNIDKIDFDNSSPQQLYFTYSAKPLLQEI